MTLNKRIIAFVMLITIPQGLIQTVAHAMNWNEFNGRDFLLYMDGSTFAAQINNENQTSDKSSGGSSNLSDINWHKVLGWTTIAAGTATFAALGFGSKDVHCGLAYFSTAMAAATCFTGYYSYFDVLGNDAQYTIHAILGTLATIGFGAASALADGGPHASGAHAVVGAVSGVTFVVSLGTLFF